MVGLMTKVYWPRPVLGPGPVPRVSVAVQTLAPEAGAVRVRLMMVGLALPAEQSVQ